MVLRRSCHATAVAARAGAMTVARMSWGQEHPAERTHRQPVASVVARLAAHSPLLEPRAFVYTGSASSTELRNRDE